MTPELDDSARRVTRVFEGWLPDDRSTTTRFKIGHELFQFSWDGPTVSFMMGQFHYMAERETVLRSTEPKTPK
jgi:hypothetical protein